MKNNDLQGLKPIYIHEGNHSSDNEISLIDLAMVLIKRKTLISLIVTGFIVFSISAALLTPKKYTYSTSIEIGSQLISGSFKSFESPQTLLAKLQHSFIPQALSDHRQTNQKDSKKYNIEVNIPKSSRIVVLKTNGTEDKADTIKKLLQDVTKNAIEDHKRVYEAVKQNLIAQKERVEMELSTLDTTKENYDDKERQLKSNITIYESQLVNLRNTREILPPMKSVESTGKSKRLLVGAATLIGLFIAILTAFIAEFVSKVKERNREGTDS